MIIKFDADIFLSNFYSADIEYEGYTYLSAEACFHAQKCQDENIKKIFTNLNAKDAWRMGRNSEIIKLRSDWESIKLPIMEQIVKKKFTQNLELARRLIDTGDAELIEIVGDQFWGKINGVGQNNLGVILMKIREELKDDKKLKEYIKVQQIQDSYIKNLALQVYDDQLSRNIQQDFETDESKLAYLIMTQRYRNLCTFLDKQKDKYNLELNEVEFLKKNWFLYNDLEELKFIGTDIYSDVMFVKHNIPFLYRSVGKDNIINIKNKKIEEQEKFDEIGKAIFKECLEQIKSGGRGKLFSYSKCFGKMLIKYANIIKNEQTTTIEIRKEAWINAVTKKTGEMMSVQGFIRESLEKGKDVNIPLFAIDMSNVRGNSVSNLKVWLDSFLGKQEYVTRNNDIFDPVGDAEVVSNFTGDMKNEDDSFIMCSDEIRYTLNIEEFCSLVYEYAHELAKMIGNEKFQKFIELTLETIPQDSEYSVFYSGIIKKEFLTIDQNKIADILSNIDWEKEKFYMSRVKAEKEKLGEDIPSIDIFKKDDCEGKSRYWKEIVFEGLRGKYTMMNCSIMK